MIEEKECCICLQKLKDNITKLNCSHCYHSKCINEWTKNSNSCPICRKQIINDSKNNCFSKQIILLSILISLFCCFILIFIYSYINKIIIKIKNSFLYYFDEFDNLIKKIYSLKIEENKENEITKKIFDIINSLIYPKKIMKNKIKEFIKLYKKQIIKEITNNNNKMYLLLYNSFGKLKNLMNIISMSLDLIF